MSPPLYAQYSYPMRPIAIVFVTEADIEIEETDHLSRLNYFDYVARLKPHAHKRHVPIFTIQRWPTWIQVDAFHEGPDLLKQPLANRS